MHLTQLLTAIALIPLVLAPWPFSKTVPSPKRWPMDMQMAECTDPDGPKKNIWKDIVKGKALMIGFWFGD